MAGTGRSSALLGLCAMSGISCTEFFELQDWTVQGPGHPKRHARGRGRLGRPVGKPRTAKNRLQIQSPSRKSWGDQQKLLLPVAVGCIELISRTLSNPSLRSHLLSRPVQRPLSQQKVWAAPRFLCCGSSVWKCSRAARRAPVLRMGCRWDTPAGLLQQWAAKLRRKSRAALMLGVGQSTLQPLRRFSKRMSKTAGQGKQLELAASLRLQATHACRHACWLFAMLGLDCARPGKRYRCIPG